MVEILFMKTTHLTFIVIVALMTGEKMVTSVDFEFLVRRVVMANTPTKIDWDSPVTKKHIKEAKAVGLTLIGAENQKVSNLPFQ